jgi:hypothetical protein
MIDLYSILTKAVGALDPNTPQARRSLYERARAALVAETRGSDPVLNQADFEAAWNSLEEVIGRIEADAQRERLSRRPTPTKSTSLPRGSAVTASPRPAMRSGEQHRRPLMRFLTRVFGRDPDGASRYERRRPAERGEGLPSNLSGEMDSAQGRDNWLSDLLARASRDEHESGGSRANSRRDYRRDR